MRNESKRILPMRKFTGAAEQPITEAWDAGAYKTISAQCRIAKPGSAGGFLVLQHSATNEEGSFINIPGASWEVNGAGGYVHIADFLRYVRWATSGTIAQDPVVGIDAVAKQ